MKGSCVIAMSVLVTLLGHAGCADTVPAPSVAGARVVPGELGPDGALRFASAAEFFDAVEAVDGLSAAELDAWERELGFMSMRRGFRELEARLETSTGDERAAMLAAHADLLDRYSVEPRRRVPAYGYAALVDRRGVMYVDGVVHKVTETDVLSSLDGKLETIDGVLARAAGARPNGADAGGVSAFLYTADRPTTASLTSSCGSVMSGQQSTSDRRVKYETRTFTFTVTTPIGYKQYRYRIEWEFWGYKKVLWSWVSYATTYQMYNVGIEMDVLKVTGYDGVRHQYEYRLLNDYFFSYYDSNNEASNGVASVFAGDMVENVDPSALRAPFFRRLHQETTSRGTYPTRGILECNYCGDGTCLSAVGETASSCRSDCGYCGDGVCFGTESSSWCSDCVPPSPCLVEPCAPCWIEPCVE